MRRGIRALLFPAALVLLGCAVLIGLGNWQMERLAWKTDLIRNVAERPYGPVQDLPGPSDWSGLDLAAAEYRPFRLRGQFLHDKEALVFTSLADPNGRERGPGYWVVTPFALAQGGVVLVNRGFTPEPRKTAAERGEIPPGGTVTVVGLLRPSDRGNVFTPEDRPDRNIFFARNVEAIAAAKNLAGPVAPFTVDLVAAETPAGWLPQAGETRTAFTNNHLGYAFTWYGLAAALAAVFVAYAWSALRGGARPSRLTPPGRAP